MTFSKKKFNCYITIDYEEWYHIEYLKSYELQNNNIFCCSLIDNFIEKLALENIKYTVFVVSDISKKNKNTINKMIQYGNKIGCHTNHHQNLKYIDDKLFLQEMEIAKKELESNFNIKVNVFRAPSFSASKSKISLLKTIGFEADSSFINSSANEFYEKNNFSDWVVVKPHIYEYNDFKEYEIPTFQFLGKSIPIAGGGFFRLIPLWFFKLLVKKYIKDNNYYMFFIHPYEISGVDLPISSQLTKKDKFRLNYGRKRAQRKFWKLISFLKKQGAIFKTIGEL